MESSSGLESGAAPRNSKRQRRPSVRLGEIGDVPLALFLENRPLKRKKKRGAAAVALIQVEDGLEEHEQEQQEQEDDDPTAVDMSGFQLKGQEAKKTKPLELVHDAEERKIGENGSDRVEIEEEEEEEEEEIAQERDREKEREKGGGEKKKKRKRAASGGGGVKKSKKSSSSSFAVKRARKDACKSKKSGSESLLGREDEGMEALAEENGEHRQEAEITKAELKESEVRESELKESEESELKEEAERRESEVDRELEDEQGGGASNVQEDGDGDDRDGGESLGREEDREERKRDGDDGREGKRKTRARTVRAVTRDGDDEVTRDGDEEERFVLPEFVRKWLQERRLGKYCDLFEFHEVDEEALPLLTVEDLREMGIHAVGSRRRMFHAILGLASHHCD